MTDTLTQTALPPLPDLDAIREAAAEIDGQVVRTPCLPAPKLSQLVGAEIYVKYENMQVTNSFKDRGALVRLLRLSEEERRRGVIAMSAGNHAQAVAYHSSRLGIPATIVMPETTPFVKVQATQARGARVVLSGETLAESQIECERLRAEQDLTLIHPYDDPDVIRGQGTIALEMLEQAPDLDMLVVPIGGGGLISGIAIAAKALRPDITIVGTEAALYPSMWGMLRGESPTCGGNTLAEGIAVKNVGKLTYAAVRALVDDIMLVDEPSLERAVNAYLTLQKTMAEGAGAAGLAAVMMAPERFAGRKVGLVLCGGNIDARILASIMVRELARGERIVALRVVIQDRPGVLGELACTIGRLGGNILEVSHHRLFLNVPAKGTSVDFTIEIRDAAHAAELITAIEGLGFSVTRLEAAESHF
ncbi:threonine ammonia-lyase [Amorphus orientalis]|uniref:L-serine dehydratase n=1 Tax=Amorphus orientalis TaxID=649198 RepID=A0AAE4ATD8_9HYPH|nr:threonine ammonia-lyase [Amorphus orientalis]MDQ0316062.1 threonine dehydratase [Amorphus orientalis]